MTKTVGMPWYSRETYEEVRGAMADSDRLPESYAYWLSSAESVEAAVAGSGATKVVRVTIDLMRFMAWCKAHGLPPDGKARSRYAADMAAASAPD